MTKKQITLNKNYNEIELVNACGIGDNPAFIEVYFILSTRNYSEKSLRKAMCKTIESGNFKTFELLASKIDVPKFELLPHWIGFKVLKWNWIDELNSSAMPHCVILQQGYAETCYHQFQTIARKHKIRGL